MTSIPLLLSEAHQCSYLDGRTATTAFIHPAALLSPPIYTQLLAQGYRRSGKEVYRPYCHACKDCIAIRIPVKVLDLQEFKKELKKRTSH